MTCRSAQRKTDSFTLAEASTIINKLYKHKHKHWPSLINAALFGCMFFTGLLLSAALAVRWDVTKMDKRTVHI